MFSLKTAQQAPMHGGEKAIINTYTISHICVCWCSEDIIYGVNAWNRKFQDNWIRHSQVQLPHNPFLTLNPEICPKQFQPIEIKLCKFRSSEIWCFVLDQWFSMFWEKTVHSKGNDSSTITAPYPTRPEFQLCTAVNNSNFWYKMVVGDLSIHQHKVPYTLSVKLSNFTVWHHT
jgi:hypothetical protein